MRRVRLLTTGFTGARPGGRAPALLLLPALAVVLLAACGASGRAPVGGGVSPPAPSAVPVPAVITEADGGRTFRVAAADMPHLRLSGQWVWTEPRTTGPIGLNPIEYFRDPGYSEWTITRSGTGQATIRSSGSPNCPKGTTCHQGPVAFAVTLVLE